MILVLIRHYFQLRYKKVTAPEHHLVLIGTGNVSAVEVYEKIWQTLS